MLGPSAMRVLALLPVLLTGSCSASSVEPDSGATVPFERCFDALAARRFIDVQSYSGAGVTVKRARTPGDGIAPGETFPYELIRFAIDTGGNAICVSDRAAMTYRYGHHNGDDSMEARAGDTIFRVTEKRIDFDKWDLALTTLDARTNAVRAGPQPLADAGCFTIPFDLNGCPGRMRTDR